MKLRVGIRREDKSRWERRVPLTPAHVAELSREARLDFIIQPSAIRVFSDDEYRRAGGKVEEDLSSAAMILAVKEIPVELLAAGKTYAFFSHVIKGQAHNMPMLARMMELGSTLIDYERIVDDVGRRLIFFGVQAGHAGAIETLWCLSRRLQARGWPDPFADVRHAYEYESLAAAQTHLGEVGARIRPENLPGGRPLILGIAGYGNVARGCFEVLDTLGVAEIAVEDLPGVASGDMSALSPVVRVVFKEEDMVERLEERDDGDAFELQDYYDHPESYRGCFDRHLQYLDVLINATYWDERYPRLVTREWARENYTDRRQARLEVIGDISCDLDGGIELTTHATEPDAPGYTYLPETGGTVAGCAGSGPVVMAVDNLPCELPREASEEFSRALRTMVGELAAADWKSDFEHLNLSSALKRGVILHRGELTPDYRHLEEHL